jgi:hypothetical protein
VIVGGEAWRSAARRWLQFFSERELKPNVNGPAAQFQTNKNIGYIQFNYKLNVLEKNRLITQIMENKSI